jgi:autoinducer 2-degrading protein
MIVTTVHVQVKSEFIESFKSAMIKNRNSSVKEPGNLRFDILQDAEDPTKFLLYEAYESDEASALHKTTAHYIEWRDTVADWMTTPRKGIKHNIISPLNKAEW